ncbi:MAG: S8 family serine peptidase [Pseudobdellovibrionaceae bacterium]
MIRFFGVLLCVLLTVPFAEARTYVPSQLIVKFKNNVASFAQNNFVQETNSQVIQRFQSNGAVLVQFPQGFMEDSDSGLKKMIMKIKARPDVEYVEPNWILHARGQVPNDPRFNDLYALGKSSSRKADIFAQEAWAKTTGSKNVLVAVIDSGVDYNHEDLKQNYWRNPGENGLDSQGKNKANNGIDDDTNGFVDDWGGWDFIKNNNNPMDDNYHGTHCAGTIGARGNNGIGITGVNWEVSLVGLKFLDKEGSGSLANAVLAIEYGIKIGVDVMSNSWGGDEYSDTMAAAIRKANAAGILFVAAAGNNASNNDVSLDYPSAYNIENIISVAATDSEGELASFSNYGPKTVHVAAPGAQILSTFPNNQYSYLDGTSMAAPLVAGAAALIKSRFPQFKAAELKARILAGATRTSALDGKVITGLLNIDNSMNDNQTQPSPVRNITVAESKISSILLQWQPSSGDRQQVYGYAIRRSRTPVNSESDWQQAEPANNLSLNQIGTKVQLLIGSVPINSSGYFSVRAVDRLGNFGTLSESVPYATKRATFIYDNKNNSMAGLSAEGTWGTEVVNGETVISDSPGGSYGYNIDASLTLPPLKISSRDAVLSFKSKFEFEPGYDFGYVELSTDDGQSWKQLAQFNGAQTWTEYTYALESFLDKSASILIRFRVKSDATHSMDGWYLSQISVLN